MRRYKLVCSLKSRDVLLQTLLWLLLVLVTAGLAAPFFAYYFVRLMINRTELHELPESV
jgi:Kef-type K+ transport system membrane component KefB